MRATPIRLAASAATVLLAAAALTGCAAGAGGGCAPRAEAGTGSDAVRVAGDFGVKPTVTFPTPLHVRSTQVSTVIAGSGAPVQAAQQIVADVTLLDGTTGAVSTATDYTGDSAAARFVIGKLPIPGLQRALACARAGERLVAVIPPGQGLPASSTPQGVGSEDSLVAVVDVRKAYPSRATGVPQVMPGGLPSVVLAPDGRPGITLPEGSPPSTLQVADLRRGSGAVIRRGDVAVVNYTVVLWKPGAANDGKVVDTSWTDGVPRELAVRTDQVVKGVVTALTGQRVGSQVLAVLPPSEAYGNQASGSVPAGSTLVFVVDVLGKA